MYRDPDRRLVAELQIALPKLQIFIRSDTADVLEGQFKTSFVNASVLWAYSRIHIHQIEYSMKIQDRSATLAG